MAPVAVILYLRPEHAQRTLLALSLNYLAKETEVYVFINVPDKQRCKSEALKANKNVIDVANEFHDSFGKYHVVVRKEYLECNESICGAINEVLTSHDRVIVLEDDIETKKDFLSYMNAALDYYECDQSVWNISAYCPMMLKSDAGNVFRACSFMPWGWGVWKDRWDMVDWERKRENLCAIDFPFMRKNMPLFDLAARRDIMTGNRFMYWDYIYSLTQARLKLDTIYPMESMVFNFGNDGSGETELDGFEDVSPAYQDNGKSWGCRDFVEYQLNEDERDIFTELLYYRHQRSPMDKEAYNKRFWFYIWLKLKTRGARLEEYLISHGVTNIAVYGMGYAGELLCEELNDSKVKVEFIMDRSGRSVIENIPLLSLSSNTPCVDLIIVTVSRAFTAISKEIKSKITGRVISFEDLLFEWALEEHLEDDKI